MEYPSIPPRLARGLDRIAYASWARAPWNAAAELAGVLAPSDCVFCGEADAVFCASCSGAFRSATVRPFPAQDGAEGLPLLPHGEPLRVVAAGAYAREVSAAILAFKDRQRVSLSRILGPALAGAIHVAALESPGPLSLVPIPSSGMARARRGYAPVDLLLAWVVRRGLLPPEVDVVPALRVVPRPPWDAAVQKGRGRRARRTGAAQLAVRPGPPMAGRCVLLVDDVLTTGATLARGYLGLVQAGARVEGAAVLAATAPPRRDPPVPPPVAGPGEQHDTPATPTGGPWGGAPGPRGVSRGIRGEK